jgi:hypothetical protein
MVLNAAIVIVLTTMQVIVLALDVNHATSISQATWTAFATLWTNIVNVRLSSNVLNTTPIATITAVTAPTVTTTTAIVLAPKTAIHVVILVTVPALVIDLTTTVHVITTPSLLTAKDPLLPALLPTTTKPTPQ